MTNQNRASTLDMPKSATSIALWQLPIMLTALSVAEFVIFAAVLCNMFPYDPDNPEHRPAIYYHTYITMFAPIVYHALVWAISSHAWRRGFERHLLFIQTACAFLIGLPIDAMARRIDGMGYESFHPVGGIILVLLAASIFCACRLILRASLRVLRILRR